MKKSFTLLIILIIGSLTGHAVNFQYNGLTYSILNETDKTCAVATNTSVSGDIVIPREAQYNNLAYIVTAINSNAFLNCSSLTSIEIPESITSIGNYAFKGCSGLTSLILDDNDETLDLGYNSYNTYGIGEGLFYDCPIKTLYLGRNLSYNNGQKYGYSPFYNKTTLTDVEIGNLVTKIGDYACYNSQLTSIKIPGTVKSIGCFAFNGCRQLKSLILEDGEETLALGYNYLNPASSTGKGLFYDCPLESLYLGRNLGYNSSDSYGYSPFYSKTTLKDVKIGECVTSIGAYAFRYCSVTSIEIPASVTSIGSEAFGGCTNISSLILKDGESELKLTSNTFDLQCKYFYLGRNLIYSTLSNTIRICYNNRELTDLEIGPYVTEIGKYEFDGCTSLTSIRLPRNLSTIGDMSFAEATCIKNIYSDAPIPPVVSSNAFDTQIYSTATLHVGRNAVASYKEAPLWENFSHIENFNPASKNVNGLNYIFDDENLTASVTYAKAINLNNYAGYTEIAIPASVELSGKEYSVVKIDDEAFNYCWSLKSVELPASINNIGNSAFGYCTSLRKIIIPESVISIGDEAFTGCSALAEISLNDGLETIGDYAFFGCTGVGTLDIPSTVESIGDNAFMGIHWLNDVYANALTPHNAPQTAFSANSYNNATLHVPAGTKDLYLSHPTWSKFNNIQEVDLTTGIESISLVDKGDISVFTIEGIKLNITTKEDINLLPKGLYIINGKKTIVN